MQEDKHLKELLMKWGVEHPSADFAYNVMQRITSAYASGEKVKPLFRERLPQVLLGIFILACIALFALSFMKPATVLPIEFTIQLPSKYLLQSLQFLIVFWLVMVFNIVLRKYFVKTL